MKHLLSSLTFLAATMAWLLLAPTPSAMAQVTVYSDPIQFELATGAVLVPIPDSQTAFPGTNCGSGDTGPTGAGSTVQIVFNSNRVTITGAAGNNLCIFDAGTIINSGNTNPSTMLANTIVGNGEDDFLLVFDEPVFAVGFRFLTNNQANETVTLKDGAGNTLFTQNIDVLTPPNARPFVGFASQTPFKSMIIDTTGGAVENEGFDALRVAEARQVRIDIKPNSPENTVNPRAGGVIPTAIFSDNGFSAADLDPTTLRLAGAPVKSTGGSQVLCQLRDLNADGLADLLCHFQVPSDLQLGDAMLALDGETYNGTKIHGQDSIRLVPAQ